MALEAFNTFLTTVTDSNRLPQIELTVFECHSDHQGYQSDEIVETAQRLFEAGQRKQWAAGAREEYNWTWQLDNRDLDKAIAFMTNSLRRHKYYIGPVQLLLSYDFKWVNPVTKQEYRFQNEEYMQQGLHTHVLLFLSKTNTIIPSLYFPFEEVNDEFMALKRQIDLLLPVDLKEKNFRLWIPRTKREGYIRKKINEKVWC